MNTTEQAEAGAMLPNLPESFGDHCVTDSVRTMREPGYTADQMRAYAQAAIDALTRKGGEAVAVVGKDGYPHWLASWLTSESYRTLETGTKLYTEPTRAQEGQDWKACYSTIIKALGAMVNVSAPDKLFDLDAIPRDPIMEQVTRIKTAIDSFSKSVEARPDAAISAAPRDGDNIKHNEER